MSGRLRATVLSPYPFHMMHQAQQLHQAGVLDRMVTAIPPGRTGLPRNLVRTRMRWTAVRRVGGRAAPWADRVLSRALVRDFDHWAVSQVGEPDVVNGLSGFATSALIHASARGAAVFCDRGSWHILEQQRVLDEEADRIGAPREYFDPFIVERELREYALADRILVPSEPARQSFVRRGIDASRLVKAPYGVDVSMFSVPGSPPPFGGIVCVASVGLQKGHYHLVKAFRMLKTKNATLTLVGTILPGWDNRLCLEKAGIRSTGPVSQRKVVEELQRASVFVLASVHDGFGMVIAQAMACGVPVIATEATGIRELITDGIEGIVVPAPPDAESIAKAIDWLLSDEARAREMGMAARRKVESLGGWDRYGSQVVAAFRESRPPLSDAAIGGGTS